MGQTTSSRHRWRGRRPVSLLLFLLILALAATQVGPNVLAGASWLAKIVLPQHGLARQQRQGRGGAQVHGLPVPAALQRSVQVDVEVEVMRPRAAARAAGAGAEEGGEVAGTRSGLGAAAATTAAAAAAAHPRHADTSALPAEQAARLVPRGANDSYASLCIIAKDEHCDIREWVLHHASLGVGKIYLFDTQSEPPMRPVLDDLIASGLVAYHYLTNTSQEVELEQPGPGRSFNWQRPVYQLCLDRYGPRHKWMGFFDADEFVVMENATADNPGSLPALLQQYEVFGGLALHWRTFAFNGHVLRPTGGVMASYTACYKSLNTLVKSIVQPKRVRTIQTVHTFAYRGRWFAVNTARAPVRKPAVRQGKETAAGAVLHHYVSRSLADFEVKQRRRGGAGSVKTLEDFIYYHRKSKAVCGQAVPLGLAMAARYDLNRNVPERCLDTEERWLKRGGKRLRWRQRTRRRT